MTRALLLASAAAFAPAAFAQHMNHTPGETTTPEHAMPQHGDHAVHVNDTAHMMSGALGAYPIGREASGTSWAPDITVHGGLHTTVDNWTFMRHVSLYGIHSSQEGPRGDDKTFVAGMFMGSARRTYSNGNVLQFRGMISPDPLMGKSGYPLLLASGETADGVEPLIDRQHPHDLFMEMSASYSMRLSDADSIFVYGGLPGEPAFGPPAFMHRPAAMENPEAPITHHWLDSTHITFGVVTLGWTHDNLRIEGSRFHGREPDENRYDIETGELDSSSIRVSWNPTPNWSLQTSWADLTSPEQLEPDEDETRWSTSALYARDLRSVGRLSASAAFGRKKRSDGVSTDGWVVEVSLQPDDRWTIFSRAETIETGELGSDHHGPIENASRIGVGVIRDWRLNERVKLGIGGNIDRNMVSDNLRTLYDGDPLGGTVFVRLKVG